MLAWWKRLAVAVVTVFVGLSASLFGLIGFANAAESACFDDLDDRPEYGGYTMSAGWWPPSFRCTLRGSDVATITIDHDALAWARIGGHLTVLVAVIVVLVLIARWPTRVPA